MKDDILSLSSPSPAITILKLGTSKIILFTALQRNKKFFCFVNLPAVKKYSLFSNGKLILFFF